MKSNFLNKIKKVIIVMLLTLNIFGAFTPKVYAAAKEFYTTIYLLDKSTGHIQGRVISAEEGKVDSKGSKSIWAYWGGSTQSQDALDQGIIVNVNGTDLNSDKFNPSKIIYPGVSALSGGGLLGSKLKLYTGNPDSADYQQAVDVSTKITEQFNVAIDFFRNNSDKLKNKDWQADDYMELIYKIGHWNNGTVDTSGDYGIKIKKPTSKDDLLEIKRYLGLSGNVTTVTDATKEINDAMAVINDYRQGLTVDDFIVIEASANNKVVVIQSLPKGYGTGQYLEKDGFTDLADNVTFSDVADYVLAGYDRNFTSDNGGFDNFIVTESKVQGEAEDLGSKAMNTIYSLLGLTSIENLLFNTGTVKSGYFFGIMRNSWFRSASIFYWAATIISILVLLAAIVKMLGHRSLSVISPAERVSMKESIINIILSIVLIGLFMPIFYIMCNVNYQITSALGTLLGNRTLLGNQSWTFLANLALIFITFRVNVEFIVRGVTIMLCYIVAPVMLASIGLNRRNGLFTSWFKELFVNIFIQTFDAIVIGTLALALRQGVGYIERILIVYSIIPLNRWVKNNLFGMRGSGSEAVAERAYNGASNTLKNTAAVGAVAGAAGIAGSTGAYKGSKEGLLEKSGGEKLSIGDQGRAIFDGIKGGLSAAGGSLVSNGVAVLDGDLSLGGAMKQVGLINKGNGKEGDKRVAPLAEQYKEKYTAKRSGDTNQTSGEKHIEIPKGDINNVNTNDDDNNTKPTTIPSMSEQEIWNDFGVKPIENPESNEDKQGTAGLPYAEAYVDNNGRILTPGEVDVNNPDYATHLEGIGMLPIDESNKAAFNQETIIQGTEKDKDGNPKEYALIQKTGNDANRGPTYTGVHYNPDTKEITQVPLKNPIFNDNNAQASGANVGGGAEVYIPPVSSNSDVAKIDSNYVSDNGSYNIDNSAQHVKDLMDGQVLETKIEDIKTQAIDYNVNNLSNELTSYMESNPNASRADARSHLEGYYKKQSQLSDGNVNTFGNQATLNGIKVNDIINETKNQSDQHRFSDKKKKDINQNIKTQSIDGAMKSFK